MDLLDRKYQPELCELSAYVGNPAFDALCAFAQTECGARHSVEYSGDKVLEGWNVKLCRSGRTLCRLYPKPGRFQVLVVVGRKEKARVESLLPGMSSGMQTLYHGTQEGMGQRWLLADLSAEDEMFREVQTLVRIRRETR